MATLTEELIEEFSARVGVGGSPNLEEAELFCDGLSNARRNGALNVDKDVDFEHLFGAWAGNGDAVAGRRKLRALIGPGTRELTEHVLDVMTSSNFKMLVNTVIQQGTIDALTQAPFTLTNVVDRDIRVDANTNKIYGIHDMGDIVQPAEELEETPLYGLQTRSVTMPKAQKEKFGLGLTRELMALDTNGLIRRKMQEGASAMNLHAEKLIADMIFGIYDPANNPWPYIEDDVSYNTYYEAGGGGPWTNDLDSNPPDGTLAPIQAIADLNESLVDDYTGEPVVNSMSDLVVTSEAAAQLFRDAMGVMMIERDGTGAGNERVAFTRPADNGGFTNVIKSVYARKRLTDWYQTTAGGSLSAADALAAAHDTWVVGDLRRAFGWATEWAFETLTRTSPDSWEYFNQEIVFLIKYMWKVTPVVKNPRLVIRNKP